MTCPHCKETAKFEGYRTKDVVSLLAPLCLQRTYYHCKHCGQGHFPWDATLSLSGQRYTLAVREITAARRRLSHAAGENLVETLDYVQSNVHRPNYSEYLERGGQMATGAVESACKTVVNQRLGLGGMRWGEEGGDSHARLRALYRSDPDQWDAYWSQLAMAI